MQLCHKGPADFSPCLTQLLFKTNHPVSRERKCAGGQHKPLCCCPSGLVESLRQKLSLSQQTEHRNQSSTFPTLLSIYKMIILSLIAA